MKLKLCSRKNLNNFEIGGGTWSGVKLFEEHRFLSSEGFTSQILMENENPPAKELII